ncbi:zinc finger protein CONSTANS-LIKE 2-like [Salvia hispanica]|uniref:zinc finger protein CONSTANS-LIKE 2-like n=1 Tax=Salvia hispanica TaxID=49212 RepID=UPI002008F75E|nr:zinc finger protein CONSTANS-LIKE 2-like [Salvia hispanica]
MKKTCELCKQAARLLCESDQAILCWDCDARVHSANFLVARHSRNLLCRACQSPTSWCSTGSKLSPTFSSCRKCADHCDEEEKSASAAEEMAENHVAPWSPPPESSLSGGESAPVARKRRDRAAIIEDLNICADSVATARCKSRRSEAVAPEERDVDLNLTLGLFSR